jgi:hypothetical protein
MGPAVQRERRFLDLSVTSPALTEALERLAAARLVTSRYPWFRDQDGVPIRSTRTPPRTWPHAELVTVRSLMPSRAVAFGNLDHDTARGIYRAGLDAQADTIVADLDAVARSISPGEQRPELSAPVCGLAGGSVCSTAAKDQERSRGPHSV